MLFEHYNYTRCIYIINFERKGTAGKLINQICRLHIIMRSAL